MKNERARVARSFIQICKTWVTNRYHILIITAYFLIAIIISKFSTLDVMYKSYILAPIVFLFPILIGNTVISLLQLVTSKKNYRFHCIICQIYFEILIGTVTFAFITLLAFNVINSTITYKDYILYLCTIVILLNIFPELLIVYNRFYKNLENSITMACNTKWSKRGPLLAVTFIVLVIGICSAMQIRERQPFPLIQNPAYSYILFTLSIIDGNSFYLRSGHAHTIALLASVPAAIGNVHPLCIFHAVPYLIHLAYPLIVFTAVYSYAKDEISAAFVSFIATFLTINVLNNFSGNAVLYLMLPYTIHFLKHLEVKLQRYTKLSIVHLITLYIMLTIFNLILLMVKSLIFIRNILFFILLGISMILILLFSTINALFNILAEYFLVLLYPVLFHEYNSLFYNIVVISIILCQFLLKNRRKKSLTKIRVIYLLYVALVYSFIILQLYGLIKFNDNFILSGIFFGEEFTKKYRNEWFDMNAVEKINYIRNNVPDVLLFLSAVSAVLNPLIEISFLPLSFGLITLLFVYFLPEGLLWRAKTYTVLFFALNSVLPFYISRYLKIKININRIYSKRYLRMSFRTFNIIILILVLVLFTDIFKPRLRFIEAQCNANYEHVFSQLLSHEAEAVFWIYHNVRHKWIKCTWYNQLKIGSLNGQTSLIHDALILSDPYTMFMLEGLTGIPQAVSVRIWVDENEYPSYVLKEFEEIKKNVFLNGSDVAYFWIYSKWGYYSNIMIVFSERTYLWIERSNIFFVWYPINLTKLLLPLSLNDSLYYEVIYYKPYKFFILKVKKNINFGSTIIADDNQSILWEVVKGDIVLLDDNESMLIGRNCLHIMCNGSCREWVIKMNLRDKNLSNADFFQLYFKGSGTGVKIRISFVSRTGKAEITFFDKSKKWRVIRIDKSKLRNVHGIMDWSNVCEIVIMAEGGKSGKINGEWRIDCFRYGKYIHLSSEKN